MEHLKPRPVGKVQGPRHVEARERVLVEWVANATPGDQIPEPWRWASRPTWSVIITLVDIGVIPSPGSDVDMTVLTHEASVAARVWLEAHPADGGSLPAA